MIAMSKNKSNPGGVNAKMMEEAKQALRAAEEDDDEDVSPAKGKGKGTRRGKRMLI